jgi:hypothetical protein
MPVPDFSPGEVLTAGAMDSIGLWLVKTVTIGTGVSSVPVTSCFSSLYTNYRIVVDSVAGGTGSMAMQLSGATGNTYLMGGTFFTFTSATVNGYGPPITNRWTDAFALETNTSSGVMDIFAPNLPRRTTATANSIKSGAGGATEAHYFMNFLETSTAQHTGFTITPISGTLTGGTIRVYGYRN